MVVRLFVGSLVILSMLSLQVRGDELPNQNLNWMQSLVHETDRVFLTVDQGQVWARFETMTGQAISSPVRVPVSGLVTEIFRLNHRIWALTKARDLVEIKFDVDHSFCAQGMGTRALAVMLGLPAISGFGALLFESIATHQRSLVEGFTFSLAAAVVWMIVPFTGPTKLKPSTKAKYLASVTAKVSDIVRGVDGKISDVRLEEDGELYSLLQYTKPANDCARVLEFGPFVQADR